MKKSPILGLTVLLSLTLSACATTPKTKHTADSPLKLYKSSALPSIVTGTNQVQHPQRIINKKNR